MPHQYVLGLENPNRPLRTPTVNKPHLVHYDKSWHLFRTKWKSQFRGCAFALSALTIPELQDRIKPHHRLRFP